MARPHRTRGCRLKCALRAQTGTRDDPLLFSFPLWSVIDCADVSQEGTTEDASQRGPKGRRYCCYPSLLGAEFLRRSGFRVAYPVSRSLGVRCERKHAFGNHSVVRSSHPWTVYSTLRNGNITPSHSLVSLCLGCAYRASMGGLVCNQTSGCHCHAPFCIGAGSGTALRSCHCYEPH